MNWFYTVLLFVLPVPISAATITPSPAITLVNADLGAPASQDTLVGTALSAGRQQLAAVFSPTDNTGYSSATAQTSLVVSAAAATPTPTQTLTPKSVGCGGPAINLNSGMSTSTIQSTISSAPSCALINFAGGTYNLTKPLTLKCGMTYTGLEVNRLSNGMVIPAVNLNSTFGLSGTIFNFYGPQSCTQTTTIQYLNFHGSDGIYIQAPNENFLIQHNTFTGLLATNSGQNTAGVFLDGPNQASVDKDITIQWNSFGDTSSCISPNNQFNQVNNGTCHALVVFASVNGIVFHNNNLFHLTEGVHWNCPNFGHQKYACEPPGGARDYAIDAQFNDFSNIHRITWEEQPQAAGGIIVQNNSEHDWLNPDPGSFGFSFACCANGTSAPPLNVSNNLIIFNVHPWAGRYGYGIEAMGFQATYSHNMLQSGIFSSYAQGIAWGNGGTPQPANATFKFMDNYICGTWSGYPSKLSNYISREGVYGDGYTPLMTGSNFQPKCAATTSMAPTVSPLPGGYSGPLTVTLTDPGYTSGAVALGNTSIWYTIDGSTPVPGKGTTQFYTVPFPVSPPKTVKAVGMWGAENQPTSYPSGFGFVPSRVVTATYSPAAAIQRLAGVANTSNSLTGKITPAVGGAAESAPKAGGPTLESVAIAPSQAVVAIGGSTQLKAIATFNDGSIKDVTAEFGWQSSDQRSITVNASGVLAGIASGPAAITGNYQGLAAKVAATSTVGEVDWQGPLVISTGGTYSGNWQSTDAKTPAVMVTTTEPVIIENSHFRGTGDLIASNVQGSNLTVRNNLGLALNAGVKGQPNGKFLEVTSPARLDVENNYIENAQAGVIVQGYGGKREGEPTIVIRANRARNLNGLLSDGNGTYLPGEGANRTHAHFIELENVRSVPGIDVGWNEVINYPGRSLVDDNIDIYRSSGTANQPLAIHDTYIQGAYPYKPAQDVYTGGGIKTDGSIDDTVQDATAFNSIHDNQVIGTVSYGIDFAAGHDNVAINNRVISSGLLSDGTTIAAQGVGLAAGVTARASSSMYNNVMRDNLVGWMCWKTSCAQTGYRMDQLFPASPADYSANSVIAAGQITFNMENNEYQVWLDKVSSAAVAVGPTF